jgi:hypothetical protein
MHPMTRAQLFAGLAGLLLSATFAQAHGWGFGINIGVPGPWYPRPYPYYYRPYPAVIYAAPPPPVVVQPAPQVIYQQAPTTTVVPVPSVTTAPATTTVRPAVVQAQVESQHQGVATRVDECLRQLNDPREAVRRNAALDLGRMKAGQAVDPLVGVLSSDASPTVRETAARALGLIGSPRSLTALINAAQADQDRDVRHSAQFAVEIVRSNLRSN